MSFHGIRYKFQTKEVSASGLNNRKKGDAGADQVRALGQSDKDIVSISRAWGQEGGRERRKGQAGTTIHKPAYLALLVQMTLMPTNTHP